MAPSSQHYNPTPSPHLNSNDGGEDKRQHHDDKFGTRDLVRTICRLEIKHIRHSKANDTTQTRHGKVVHQRGEEHETHDHKDAHDKVGKG